MIEIKGIGVLERYSIGDVEYLNDKEEWVSLGGVLHEEFSGKKVKITIEEI